MGEFRATCFGFEELTDGYFCLGVYAGDDDEVLEFSGAGYWTAPEAVEEDDAVLDSIDDMQQWLRMGHLFGDEVGAIYSPDSTCDNTDASVDCYLLYEG